MSRTFWGLWFILAGGLSAAEPEVRCYRMGWTWMERAASGVPLMREEGRDPFAVPEELPEDDWFWKRVDDPGFESRFLKEGGGWRDCGALLARWLDREFSGEAVYDMMQEHLVMRADPADHEAWQRGMSQEFPRQIRLQVSGFELPYGMAEGEATFWDEAPEAAKELASVSGLGVPGELIEARTSKGELSYDAETQLDHNDEFIDLRLTARFRGGQGFTVKSGWTLPPGVTWVEKVGSVDGETDLVLAIRADLVLPSGVLFDEWVLKEEGGVFLGEERLCRLRWHAEAREETPDDAGVHKFAVPATFLTWINIPEGGGRPVDDPFAAPEEEDEGLGPGVQPLPAYEGAAPELRRWRGTGLLDVRELLRNNGVDFRKGDFAVFSRSANMLIVKADPVNIELLRAIISLSPDPGGPRLIRLALVQWEGGDESETAGKRARQGVGAALLPGQMVRVDLGKTLSLEAEGWFDPNDEIIELRTTLSESPRKKKEVMIKTGVTVESGRSVVIQESRVEGKRRAWVLTARVVTMGSELDVFLREAE